mgnify:CR=1 FL=1
MLLDSKNDSYLDNKIADIMKILYNFNETKNAKVLCNEVSSFLDLPIILRTDNIYFSKTIDKNEISRITSKLLNTQNVKDNIDIPITIIYEHKLIVAYYSNNCFIAVYFEDNMINSNNVKNFNTLAPILLNIAPGIYERVFNPEQYEGIVKVINNMRSALESK